MRFILPVAALASTANAYFLAGGSFIAVERSDPIVSPGGVSSHAHAIMGGSNFRINVTTDSLRESYCTSFAIEEDKSNYWWPQLYFQWKNGSFTSVNGGAVVYYLFSDKPGVTTPFPDNFRMISGDPTLRTYNASSFAQQAVTFLCLDFQGTATRHNELPSGKCVSGVRSQLNFPSCWDGKNADSHDHKSHVAFLSTGPDSGTCNDPKYPKTLPRIFTEIYWSSQDFDSVRDQALNPDQPFVFSDGDGTGYGYHGDYYNGWATGVLQNVVDKCHCNPFGDPTCCANQGIFTLNKNNDCHITKTWDEQTTGTIPKLPGNNPVQQAGTPAMMLPNNYVPAQFSPVYAYLGNSPSVPQAPVVAPARVVSASSSEPTVRVAEPSVATTSSSNGTSPSKATPSQNPDPSGATTSSSNGTPSQNPDPSGATTSSSKGTSPSKAAPTNSRKKHHCFDPESSPSTSPAKARSLLTKSKHNHHRRMHNAAF